MISLKKRIPKGNILLLISFAAISVSFLLIVSAAHAGKYTMLSQNSMYTGHEVDFTLYESKDDGLWDNVIPKLSEEYDDFALYCPIKNEDYILRGIYVKGRVVSPPMIWGQYFDEKTSWADEPLAVVGKSCEEEITEINGKRCFSYDGTDYEVIGIMGTANESRINEMVFLNFKSVIEIKGINTEYVVDIRNQKELNNIGNKIYGLISGKADCVIYLPGSGVDVEKSIFSKGVIMDTLYVMMLISFSLCTVIITEIWLKYRRQLFFALRLCGFPGYVKILEVYKGYGLISFLGYIVGIGLLMVVSGLFYDLQVNISDIVIAFILSVGLGTVIFAIIYMSNEIKKNRKRKANI